MLTDRERKLMLAAFETGFIHGVDDVENGYSNTPQKERFESWLSEVIADNGGTVEQYLDWDAS